MSVVKKPSRTEYLAALRNKVQEISSPKSNTHKQEDDRYWKPEKDATGKGSAIIRFLPAKIGEEYPFVQLHTHAFQGPTSKWLIDNCPTSIGETCPVCKANTALWNSGVDADKKLASSRKRKLIYISNILVVTDPKHPENNGKVFLFKYGKKIFDMVKDMLFPDELMNRTPVDPFDPEEGVNFLLRVIKKDGFPNYDKSEFETTPSVIGDEDEMAAILDKMYSLNEIIDPSHFKSYVDLKKRFDLVTGETSVEDGDSAQGEPESNSETATIEKPQLEAPAEAEVVKATKPARKPRTESAAANTTPDDTDSDVFFANLAKQSQGAK